MNDPVAPADDVHLDRSLGVVKRFILVDQRSRQDPDRFQPRRPGETSSKPPPCVRPKRAVALKPGDKVEERWELPFDDAFALQAVGSAQSLVRAEVVEPRDPKEPEFLDMLPTGWRSGNGADACSASNCAQIVSCTVRRAAVRARRASVSSTTGCSARRRFGDGSSYGRRRAGARTGGSGGRTKKVELRRSRGCPSRDGDTTETPTTLLP